MNSTSQTGKPSLVPISQHRVLFVVEVVQYAAHLEHAEAKAEADLRRSLPVNAELAGIVVEDEI